MALGELDKITDWSLNWVKGHSGVEGNERADILAKKGSSLKVISPQPIKPISPRAFASWHGNYIVFVCVRACLAPTPQTLN